METGATDGVYLRAVGMHVYGVSGIFEDINDIRKHSKDERILKKSLYEGQIYPWINIGSQIWMAENLRFPANRDCWTNHDIKSDTTPFGRVYSWKTARTSCPEGWHLPDDAEWLKLINYLGGSKIAGGRMKEAGIMHWQQPNTGATNVSGFSVIPAVTNESQDRMTFAGITASFRSSSPASWTFSSGRYQTRYGKMWRLFYDSESIKSGSGQGGLSVRCIRDRDSHQESVPQAYFHPFSRK